MSQEFGIELLVAGVVEFQCSETLMPRRWVSGFWRFGGTCGLHLEGISGPLRITPL
jgi:hypothetical protein